MPGLTDVPPQTLVDVDMFMDIRRIELGLVNHSCTEALAWCNENKAALRKAKVRHLYGLLSRIWLTGFGEHVGI